MSAAAAHGTLAAYEKILAGSRQDYAEQKKAYRPVAEVRARFIAVSDEFLVCGRAATSTEPNERSTAKSALFRPAPARKEKSAAEAPAPVKPPVLPSSRREAPALVASAANFENF